MKKFAFLISLMLLLTACQRISSEPAAVEHTSTDEPVPTPRPLPTTTQILNRGELIYIQDSTLHMRDMTTGNINIVEEASFYLNAPGAGQYLSASPQGKNIAFNGYDPQYGCPTYHPDQPCVMVGPTGFFLLDRITAEINLIAPFATTNLSWAPLEDRFVYAIEVFDQSPYQVHLRISTPEGGERFELTAGEFVDLYPAWSPRGDWIAFLREPSPPPDLPKCVSESDTFNSCSDPALYIVRPDGSELTLISKHVRTLLSPYNAPSWSADGVHIAVVSGIEGQDISVFNIDTFEEKTIKGLLPLWQTPVWSPMENIIGYAAKAEKEVGVFLADMDENTLTRLSNTDQPASDLFWSVDGVWVAYLNMAKGIRMINTHAHEIETMDNVIPQFLAIWIR